jgi:hypothetical protein
MMIPMPISTSDHGFHPGLQKTSGSSSRPKPRQKKASQPCRTMDPTTNTAGYRNIVKVNIAAREEQSVRPRARPVYVMAGKTSARAPAATALLSDVLLLLRADRPSQSRAP